MPQKFAPGQRGLLEALFARAGAGQIPGSWLVPGSVDASLIDATSLLTLFASADQGAHADVAFSWGNHSGLYASAATGALAQVAYSWGDHASAGYQPGLQYLTAVYRVASGTPGGDFTSGAWRTRTLDEVVGNTIPGASLASNQITLPAGTYYVTAHASAYQVDGNVLQFYDVTNGTELVLGFTVFANSAAVDDAMASLEGVFTLSGSAACELQHQCATTNAGDGMGRAAAVGVDIVHAKVTVWRIA